MVDKRKKSTKKLTAQELEKRKAPFASPIVNREGEGRGGGGASETTAPRGRQAPGETTPPTLPRTPIVYRNE